MLTQGPWFGDDFSLLSFCEWCFCCCSHGFSGKPWSDSVEHSIQYVVLSSFSSDSFALSPSTMLRTNSKYLKFVLSALSVGSPKKASGTYCFTLAFYKTSYSNSKNVDATVWAFLKYLQGLKFSATRDWLGFLVVCLLHMASVVIQLTKRRDILCDCCYRRVQPLWWISTDKESFFWHFRLRL